MAAIYNTDGGVIETMRRKGVDRFSYGQWQECSFLYGSMAVNCIFVGVFAEGVLDEAYRVWV